MTPALIVYLVVLPLAVAVGAAVSEWERRTSDVERVRVATLKPGLDGIVIGLCWPFVAVCAVGLGLIMLVTLAGRGLLRGGW